MKRMSLRLAVLMILCLFAFGCTKASVGVVNPKLVYENSQAGKDGTSHLEKLSAELEAEIMTMQKNMETARDKNAAQVEFQQALASMQERFISEQQMVVKKLQDSVENALQSVREKNGLSVLIPDEVSLSSAPSADFTQQVIDAMNAQKVTFTSMETEQ